MFWKLPKKLLRCGSSGRDLRCGELFMIAWARQVQRHSNFSVSGAIALQYVFFRESLGITRRAVKRSLTESVHFRRLLTILIVIVIKRFAASGIRGLC